MKKMNLLTACALATLVVAGPFAVAEEDSGVTQAAIEKRLLGEWLGTEGHWGEENPPASARRFIFRDKHEVEVVIGKEKFVGSYKIDVTKKPIHIDFTFEVEGKKVTTLTIFDFPKDDLLRVAEPDQNWRREDFRPGITFRKREASNKQFKSDAEEPNPVREAAKVHFGKATVNEITQMKSPRLEKYFPHHRFYRAVANNPEAVIAGPPTIMVTIAETKEKVSVVADVAGFLSEAKFKVEGIDVAIDLALMYAELSNCSIRTGPFAKGTKMVSSDWTLVAERKDDVWHVTYTMETDHYLPVSMRHTVVLTLDGRFSTKDARDVEMVGGYE